MNTSNRIENGYLLSRLLDDNKRTKAFDRLFEHFVQAQKDLSLFKITTEEFMNIEVGVLKKICLIIKGTP